MRLNLKNRVSWKLCGNLITLWLLEESKVAELTFFHRQKNVIHNHFKIIEDNLKK